jgi:hypothetical protein
MDAIAKLEFYLSGIAICVYIDKVSFVDQSDAPSLNDAFKSKEEREWTVYPNPFDHQMLVTCKLANHSSVRYQTYSVNGQLAAQGPLNEQGVMAANQFESGVYFLRLESDSAMETIEMVKQ